METKNSPAFPIKTPGYTYKGLTKREHFAALAMQALLSSSDNSIKTIAEVSVASADALIKELEE